MAESTIWWVLAGLAVAIELTTGTFYLLMFALGLAGAAIAAYAGYGLATQLVVAALLGGSAVTAWHLLQLRRRRVASTRNRDVNLDVGEFVQVQAWGPDGRATVKYRGANWTAIHAPGALPTAGLHRIAELQGNQLLLEKVEP